MQGLLQRTELFRSVRGPNQDPITSGGPLSELRPLIKSRWGPFGDRGAFEVTVRWGPWRSALVSKNPSCVYVRRILKAIDRFLQATEWSLSTDVSTSY